MPLGGNRHNTRSSVGHSVYEGQGLSGKAAKGREGTDQIPELSITRHNPVAQPQPSVSTAEARSCGDCDPPEAANHAIAEPEDLQGMAAAHLGLVTQGASQHAAEVLSG
jgi:hypothetical protein